mmetsp:Transcript_9604/g.14813  ORF Transcript_9604/g.14813 Transcript_9604/m.14813 type:complete len:91 (-) Transcript_9604:30-302(-)
MNNADTANARRYERTRTRCTTEISPSSLSESLKINDDNLGWRLCESLPERNETNLESHGQTLSWHEGENDLTVVQNRHNRKMVSRRLMLH